MREYDFYTVLYRRPDGTEDHVCVNAYSRADARREARATVGWDIATYAIWKGRTL